MIGMREIAALFVNEKGVYSDLEGVDVWGVRRDARRYAGPHPVVAHPPCKRWGKFWPGSIRKNTPKFELGDDNGCFESALESVRTYGGVLEHPADSHAWDWFGINKPDSSGGWGLSDLHGGFSCCVWQGWYGHPAAKKTWLYACKVNLPAFVWGMVKGEYLVSQTRDKYPVNSDCLFSITEIGKVNWRHLTTHSGKRESTPIAFRDILISIARSASPGNVPATTV